MTRDPIVHAPADRVALGDAGGRTAGALLADAGRVGRALSHHPAGEVLLISEDRYHFAAGLLGAWWAGHAVLLPPNGQPESVRELARAPGVRAFLHDRPGTGEGTDLRTLLGGEPLPGRPPPLPDERHVATVTTSGSTGPHQRCPKTAGQLLGEADVLRETFATGPAAVVLATVPAHHIYGLLFSVLLPLRAGAAFVRESPLQPEAVTAALRRHRATHLVSAPAHLRALETADEAPPLERAFSSGAPLPASTARALHARFGWSVAEIYGSTETGGIGWREGPEQAWLPFPGVDVRCGEGDRLLLDSPRLAPGEPRPYAAADRIALAGSGRFVLLGRTDGVVKVAGKRVSVAEVEARLLALPGVRDAAVLAEEVGGTRGQELAVAAVAPGWTAERLRRALSGWLDPVTLPRRIRLVDRLPREESGKLPRQRLRALFQGAPKLRRLEVAAETCERGEGGREVRTLAIPVPPELAFFRGHFDEKPVLPGVVQLDHVVLRQIRRAWPDLAAPRRVLRLKFKRLIRPGARLTLRLVRRAAEPRVDFEIETAEGGCSSGTLEFAGQGEPT